MNEVQKLIRDLPQHLQIIVHSVSENKEVAQRVLDILEKVVREHEIAEMNHDKIKEITHLYAKRKAFSSYFHDLKQKAFKKEFDKQDEFERLSRKVDDCPERYIACRRINSDEYNKLVADYIAKFEAGEY